MIMIEIYVYLSLSQMFGGISTSPRFLKIDELPTVSWTLAPSSPKRPMDFDGGTCFFFFLGGESLV